jgi:hypothetical protein
MTAIYFPFTYISDIVVESAQIFFKPIAVYQPVEDALPESMRPWAENGVLDIRVPVNGDADQIRQTYRDYRTWLQSHQGTDLSFFKMQRDSTVLFDESFVSQLSSNIKKKMHSSADEPRSGSIPLFSSRLFLYAAQAYDLNNWEIHRDFTALRQMEKDLIQNLRGENVIESAPRHGEAVEEPYDWNETNLADRLRAWSCLFATDARHGGQAPGKIFLTSSRSALLQIMAQHPQGLEVLCTAIEPQDGLVNGTEARRRLLDYLHALAVQPWNGPLVGETFSEALTGVGGRSSLSIFVIPRVSPRALFARIAKLEPFRRDNTGFEDENTVLVLMEPSSRVAVSA